MTFELNTSKVDIVKQENQENLLVDITPISLADSQEVFELIQDSKYHLSQLDDFTAQKYSTIQSVEEHINSLDGQNQQQYIIKNNEEMIVGVVNLTLFAPKDYQNLPKSIKKDYRYGEVGYWVGEPYIKQGYITDAVKSLIKLAQNQDFYDGLIAYIHQKNESSRKVLEKAGFDCVGQNEEHDIYLMQFIKE